MENTGHFDAPAITVGTFPKRLLIKISGEALKGKNAGGLDFEIVSGLVQTIKKSLLLGHEIAVVVGGGNFYRGNMTGKQNLSPVISDQMGMLATVMNGLALHDAFTKESVPSVLISGFPCGFVSETFDAQKCDGYLTQRKVIIFVGGLGAAYFTTDTAAVVRALEMKCAMVLKATQVDGVYEEDPKKNPHAKRYDRISYADVLRQGLQVMDGAAIALASENKLQIGVFSILPAKNLLNLLKGHGSYTLITTEESHERIESFTRAHGQNH